MSAQDTSSGYNSSKRNWITKLTADLLVRLCSLLSLSSGLAQAAVIRCSLQ